LKYGYRGAFDCAEGVLAPRSQPNAGDFDAMKAQPRLDPRLSTRNADIAAVLRRFPLS
jgi:hypothetical protein